MIQVIAAVARQAGAPLTLEQLEIDGPGPGEVLVDIRAAGICHTDLAVRDQEFPLRLPMVLGHEGAGVVREVGPGVEELQRGDEVVLSFASCRLCRYCRSGASAYCAHMGTLNLSGGRPDGTNALTGGVHGFFFGQSSFATCAVADQSCVVKVNGAGDLSLLAPLGCGVQTGAGTVLNRLRPSPGSSFGVFGVGAVGLAALMAAAINGCTPIVAVDLNPRRLEIARTLGATHVIDAGEQDVGSALRECCPGGLTNAIDTTAAPRVISTAVEHLAPRGTAALVGLSAPGVTLSIDPSLFISHGISVVGVVEGDSVPQVFIPELIALWRQQRFPLEKLVTTFPFDKINDACAAMHSGEVIKPVLVMD
jgi:aryl-alcohol dehydrogenase